jgi:acetyltransferase-like isoleucine patch superfamily enzyme
MPDGLDKAAARLWLQKWRWYQRERVPWNVARLHLELAKRQAFARGPLHGNVLQMLREGRLEVGPHAYFEPHVWLTSDSGRIAIGGGTLVNIGVMIAAVDAVTIGEHCMFANGCVVTDGNHRFDDVDKPVPWQGFTSKGPVRIGDNVWFGAHAVVTSGVTIGRRAVIGANSVVTEDVPEFAIAAGAPARVLKEIDH